MSEYAQAATVDIVLADYAANDATGKGNIIGAGVAVVGFDPQQGLTSRFAIWVSVHIPTSLCPAEFPVEVALVDGAGDLVMLGGPTGELQPFRIAQIVQLEKPNAPIPVAQRDHIGSRAQIVFDFNNGLPLAAGGIYEMRVRIDGDDSVMWGYPFAVAGPPPGPVIG